MQLERYVYLYVDCCFNDLSTITIKLCMLVYHKADIISSTVVYSHHDIAEQIANLELNNNHSLTHSLTHYLFVLLEQSCEINMHVYFRHQSEWVSDCCLMPIQHFFIYIIAKTSYIWWYDVDVCFVLDHLDFYSATCSSLKQQFEGRHVVPLGHISLITSKPVFALSP